MTKLNNYDLEERTAKFAESVIDLVKSVNRDSVNSRLISQVVASSGSVGANYAEANEAESKKDFVHKIRLSKKEVKESKHWLRLLARSNPELKSSIDYSRKEAHELLLIFSKIISSSLKAK